MSLAAIGKSSCAGVEVFHETITPEFAKKTLKLQAANRRLDEHQVAYLADQMRVGAWVLNGESIKFDVAGNLIDGQHRLHAVARAGVCVSMLVIRGLPSDAMPTIDTGKSRTASDFLGLNGFTNANAIAAVIRWVRGHRDNGWNAVNSSKTPPALAVEMARNDPGFHRSTLAARKCLGLAPGGMLGACHFLFSERDAQMADKFIDDLAQGAGMAASDPVFMLRERLLKHRSEHRKATTRELAAWTVKAWNARRTNQPLRIFRYKPEEAFPAIA